MMKRTGLLILSVFFVIISKAQQKQAVLDYIAQYKDIAIEEMKRTGVPAAITLAQGIHESGAGLSELTTASNNHFGIKCKSTWTGPSVRHDDDAKGECFRKYATAAESFRDHSDFLKGSPRYAGLFALNPGDYKGWAKGLKAAGYATNPKYPDVLIKLVEDYNLQTYSLIALGINKQEEDMSSETDGPKMESQDVLASRPDVKTDAYEENPPAPAEIKQEDLYPAGVFKINETKVIYAPKGTSYLMIAQQQNLSLANLFKFNDMSPADICANGQLLYLQPKRKTGNNSFHIVSPGETVWSISQTEAIRLESLLELNWLKEGQMPAVGEKLSLQKKSDSIPKLALNDHMSLLQPAAHH